MKLISLSNWMKIKNNNPSWLQVNNYNLVKHQEEVIEVKSNIEKRFSYTLLSRLLNYMDHVSFICIT